MRKNEFYSGDIELDNIFQRPGYLGSIEGLAEWAYNIYRNHPDNKLKITARKIIHTDNGPTHIEIPPLDSSEIKEVTDLVYIEGDISLAWLLTTIGLATPEQLQLT